jgi:hypothetical protein
LPQSGPNDIGRINAWPKRQIHVQIITGSPTDILIN